MTPPLLLAAGGAATNLAGLLLAQESPVETVGPWVSGGGMAAVIAGLLWMAKKLAAGELVARSVAEREEDLEKLTRESLHREQTVSALLVELRAERREMSKVLAAASRALERPRG